MTTLHILSSAYSPANTNNRADPFSMAVIKFINHMTVHGWNCIHYGISGTDVDCLTVCCLDESITDRASQIANYNKQAAKEIQKHKQPGDMIVCFFGIENKPAADAHPDLITVEPGIGYTTDAVFAEHRVFVSYAQMHMFYGARGMLMNPSWWDAVIPNAISPEEFEYSDQKSDYFLYFGRVIEAKGVNIAIQATKATGQKLIIAGSGSLADLGYATIPDHVTVVGLCDVEQRKILMKNAIALLGPTHYIEPFGNMVVEAYMSGTPAITTDWGGFAETVVHGKTGFRCREFRDFVWAINNINLIKHQDCQDWALDNYSDKVVHDQLHEYFVKIKQKDFYRP